MTSVGITSALAKNRGGDNSEIQQNFNSQVTLKKLYREKNRRHGIWDMADPSVAHTAMRTASFLDWSEMAIVENFTSLI